MVGPLLANKADCLRSPPQGLIFDGPRHGLVGIPRPKVASTFQHSFAGTTMYLAIAPEMVKQIFSRFRHWLGNPPDRAAIPFLNRDSISGLQALSLGARADVHNLSSELVANDGGKLG